MGSTRLELAAVALNGLHVGCRAYLHTVYKTGRKKGKPKSVLVEKITKVEHDGKVVRVFRKATGNSYWGPEDISHIIDFDTIVSLEVPDGK